MPENSKCPHCEQRSFKWTRKLFLGPGRTIECPECGAKVSVSWASFWINMSVVIPLLILNAVYGDELRAAVGRAATIGTVVAIGLVLLTVSLVFQHRYVDLVVRTPGRIDPDE